MFVCCLFIIIVLISFVSAGFFSDFWGKITGKAAEEPCSADWQCGTGSFCVGGVCVEELATTCGDGICEGGETCSNCFTDCGSCTPSTCDDCQNAGYYWCDVEAGGELCVDNRGYCNEELGSVIESCSDSGEACSADWQCGTGSFCVGGVCVQESTTTCGDGICADGETCSNCFTDCGSCTPQTCEDCISEEGLWCKDPTSPSVAFCDANPVGDVSYACGYAQGTTISSNEDCPHDGEPCSADWQCGTGSSCVNGVCVEESAITCFDGIQNQDETGIDCGGSICGPCPATNVTTSCTDSDGGMNYYVRGTCIGESGGVLSKHTDVCGLHIDDIYYPNTVNEFACTTENSCLLSLEERYYNCSNGCVDGACISNVELSLATLKDTYEIGEKIELTDPPGENIISQEFIENLEVSYETTFNEVNYFDYEDKETKDFIYQKELSLESAGISEDSISEEFEGYIVQFEEDPLIVEETNLKKRAEENEESFLSKVPIINNFILTSEKVPKRLRSYSDDLDRNSNRMKSRISEKISREKFSREHKKVFNGVVLDISEEEAEEIEKIRGVKKVYPNYKVQITLMDSVGLINADDVWELDEDGNDCSVSGKPCLTGEGITIAIIDTGVDYTHPDLGGEDIEIPKRDFEKITRDELDLFTGYYGWEIDQQIVMEDNKLIYYSGNEIYIYSFETNETTKINAFFSNLSIVRLAFKDNMLAYFATDNALSNPSVYFYDFNKGSHERISFERISNIGFISISNGKVIYGKGSEFDGDYYSNIYVYDILKAQTTAIAEDYKGVYTPIVSGNLIAYSVSSGVCFDKIVLYNMDTGEEKEVTPPAVGPVLDFEGDEILYIDCNKTRFDRQWRHYHLYNINTEESIPLFYDSKSVNESEVDATSSLGVTSRINKGAIGEGIVFFSKNVDGNKIVAYDRDLDKYFQINPFKTSGTIDSEGKKVCFISNNFNIYCHDYNSSKDYPVFEGGFTNKVIGGYDFINEDNDPMDDHGHGTHVAATAAGNGVLKGVAPDAKIYAYKVLDSGGSGSIGSVIAGIERAVDPNQDGNFSDRVDIISMSLGGPGHPDDFMSQTVDNVVEAGVVAVIAAGNDGPGEETIGSPGTARKAITVGASDKSGEIAEFSSRGPVIWEKNGVNFLIKPDVLAPGVNICAAQALQDTIWEIYNNYFDEDVHCLDEEHINISGTSMATPHVAGVVALLKQKNPDWTPQEIKDTLKGTSDPISGKNSKEQGFGIINIFKAVNLEAPFENIWDFAIIYPLGEIQSYNQILELKGIFPKDYDSLEVEYLDMECSSSGMFCWGGNWTKEGVSVMGSGNLIAEIDTQKLSPNIKYPFKVSIAKDGIIKEETSHYFLDSKLKKGWPTVLGGAKGGFMVLALINQPTVYDLDNDGKNEIIIAYGEGENARVYAYKEDGTQLKGFPMAFPQGESVQQAPLVGNYDEDPYGEIIVFAGGMGCRTLFKIEHDGSYEKADTPCLDPLPLFSNKLNDDETFEIYGVEYEGYLDKKKIYLLNENLEHFQNWPINIFDYVNRGSSKNYFVYPRIFASNVDQDSDKELIVQVNEYNSSYVFTSSSFYAFNIEGDLVNGWPKKYNNPLECNIQGDFDKDGEIEIICHNRYVYEEQKLKLTILSQRGYIKKEFEYDLEEKINIFGVSLGDFDGERKIVLNARTSSAIPIIYLIDKEGNLEEIKGSTRVYNQQFYPIGKINDNLENNLFLGSTTAGSKGILHFIDKNSNLFKFMTNSFNIGAVIIADIDGDLKNEIIVVDWDKYVYVWDTEGSLDNEWGEVFYDSTHSNCYKCEEEIVPKPQSKIVNNEESDIQGTLVMKLQKKIGIASFIWADEQVVTNQVVTIPANDLIKLDIGEDYGWNLKDVKASSAGSYRVYASFEFDNKKIEDNWEFEVR